MNTQVTPLNALELCKTIKVIFPTHLSYYNVFFLCVGTDRSTGDSLGPLVGSFLRKKGYKNILGTINDIVHAKNLNEKIKKIPTSKKVVVIDSMLGQKSSISKFYTYEGGLKPGAGVGKDLPLIGDYTIAGVVNVGGFLSDQVLQYTELSLVLKMAEEITEAIEERFPLPQRLASSSNTNWKITS